MTLPLLQSKSRLLVSARRRKNKTSIVLSIFKSHTVSRNIHRAGSNDESKNMSVEGMKLEGCCENQFYLKFFLSSAPSTVQCVHMNFPSSASLTVSLASINQHNKYPPLSVYLLKSDFTTTWLTDD